MDAYEALQPPGCADNAVELSHVGFLPSDSSSRNWFPEKPPTLVAPEGDKDATDVWLPEDDNEFFWQELTEDEISKRRVCTLSLA